MDVNGGLFAFAISINISSGLWKYLNYLFVQGQVNGHYVLVQRKFYLSERTDKLIPFCA